MQSFIDILKNIYLATIVLIGVAWVIDIPQYFGLSLISAEWMGPLLSIGIAAAFLKHPYSKKAGLFEIILGFAALLSWCWMSLHYADWIIDIFGYTAEKFIPGIIALLLLMEALRKSAGLPLSLIHI